MFKTKFNHKGGLRFLMPIFIIGFIICHSTIASAQKNQNLIAAVELSVTNVLYLGLDNPIKVAVSGCKATDVKVVASSNAELRATHEGTFYLRPKNSGKVTLSISCQDKLIRNAEYRVKKVPDPLVRVGMLKRDTVSKTGLLAQNRLIAEVMDFDFDYRFIIIGFKMVVEENGIAMQYQSSSSKFTNEQLDIIRELKPGQKVYFKEIKAKGSDGTVRELNNITLVLK